MLDQGDSERAKRMTVSDFFRHKSRKVRWNNCGWNTEIENVVVRRDREMEKGSSHVMYK